MPVYKTDPKQLPPPDTGAWDIVFTRKVVATTAPEINFVSTGITYDPNFEYIVLGEPVASPTPNPSAPVMSGTIALPASGDPFQLTQIFQYKPDGSVLLAYSNVPVYIAAQQDPSGLAGDRTLNTDPTTATKIQVSGLILTKWGWDATKDGHWMIARRRRYG
jgi:hypothetical protein